MTPPPSSRAVWESQAKRPRLNADQVTAKLVETPIPQVQDPAPPAAVPPSSPPPAALIPPAAVPPSSPPPAALIPASKPDIPTCPDAVGVRVLPLMRHQPLEIRAAAGEADMVSYKAPWKLQNAKLALGGTGLYEASGSLFWLNPFPSDAQSSKCAGDTPSWKSIHSAADAFRPDDIKAFEMGSEGPKGQKRILFPGVMAVHAPTLDGFLADAFPGNMQVVTGHVLIYAWYLAMFDALEGGHTLWVASLFQAALTATIRAYVCASTPELATLSTLGE